MFLLDTDVISRTSPFGRSSAELREWLLAHEHVSFVSVLTLSELCRGTALLRLKGAIAKARQLDTWVSQVEQAVSRRLLSVDRAIGRRTGDLLASAQAAGHGPSFVDACLAATAAERGLTVVTFNSRHFDAFGVPHQTPASDLRL